MIEYRYPRPTLAVDIVVFGFDGIGLQVMLIERQEPLGGRKLALPGGFVKIDESLDAAAARELREETGIDSIYLEQLYTFGAPRRDPRQRVVSVAYFALVSTAGHNVRAATDARAADWFALEAVPRLCIDHNEILETALQRLRGKIRYAPLGFELLPRKFTLGQLQRLYEAILGEQLDKRNFRKKVLSYGLLQPLDEHQKNVPHRAARLYRFDRRRYHALARSGYHFEV